MLGPDDTRITTFHEKPQGDGGWVSGGFFVVEPPALEHIAGDSTVWEDEPLESLARSGQLAAFRHRGYWQSMETLRDRMLSRTVGVGEAGLEDVVTLQKALRAPLKERSVHDTTAARAVPRLAGPSPTSVVRPRQLVPTMPSSTGPSRSTGSALRLGAVFPCPGSGVRRLDEIFGDYADFWSYSDSWLERSRNYAGGCHRLGLDDEKVVDVGVMTGICSSTSKSGRFRCSASSRPGTLPRQRWRPASRRRVEYFGRATAEVLLREGEAADLVVGNNVLAHVPDLNGFVAGLRTLLKPDGVVTMEFPHRLRLIERTEFDTIYHEHLPTSRCWPSLARLRKRG